MAAIDETPDLTIPACLNRTKKDDTAMENTPEQAETSAALAEIAATFSDPQSEKDETPLSLEEATKKLHEMTAKRDALIEAISQYKKYVQKLVGKL